MVYKTSMVKNKQRLEGVV